MTIMTVSETINISGLFIIFYDSGAPVILDPQEPPEQRINIQPAEDEEDPDDGLR